MIDYLCSSMFWSVLGFLLGYLTCYLNARKKDM